MVPGEQPIGKFDGHAFVGARGAVGGDGDVLEAIERRPNRLAPEITGRLIYVS